MLPSPYLILAALVVAIGLAAGGFFEGVHYETLKVEAAASAAKDTVLAQTVKSDAIANQVASADILAQQQLQLVTNTIVKEVPVYVTKIADRKCVIPRGFVRLHDAAATGVPPVPDPAPGADDQPAGTDLAAVGTTVATNYGKYAALRQQFLDLKTWVTAQQQLGN